MGYKHMSHIYENPDLKFSEIKDIFIKASEGKLEGTEKTDGQNMHVSFSVVDGKARASRNDSMLKGVYAVKDMGKVRKHPPGGVDAVGWAEKWAEHPSKTVRAAFAEAFEIFETAAKSLSPEEQEKIFGDGVNYLIFYNCEVQDPRNMNTIRYDKKTLTVHRVGHLYIDLKDGTVNENISVENYAYALQNSLRTMQKSIENSEFAFEINAIRQLKALTDKKPLDTALRGLESVINDAGVADSGTVGDYTIVRLLGMIRPYVSLPEEKEKLLLKKILGHKGLKINLVKKDLSPEDREAVGQLYSDRRKLLNNAIRPVENVIHDFAVEMLKSFESAFVLNQKEEVQRLRKAVEKERKEIEKSGSEEKMAILLRHMEKIKDIENISSAAEGFVFDYDGKTYKFTGNFAPINQILGIQKYDRVSTPQEGMEYKRDDSNKELSEHEEYQEETLYAIFPGKFKPPQRGHLNAVEHYSRIVDSMAGSNGKVVIMVSPKEKEYGENNEKKITWDQSIAIWKLYIEDAHLNNVDIIKSPKMSPVAAAIDFASDIAEPGDRIILAGSTKGGDHQRFAGDVKKHAAFGVEVLDPMEFIYKPEEMGGDPDMHATGFRDALAAGENIIGFIPETSAFREEEIRNILSGEEKKSLTMESLFSLVEEALSEDKKPNPWAICTSKVGREDKDKYERCVKSIKSKHNIDEDQLEEEELEEISAVSGGGMHGSPGTRKNKETLIREILQTGVATMYNDREALVQETRLRGLIRKGIKIVLERQDKEKQKSLLEEKKLRKVIRDLILETATGDNDPTPHASTGINVLEDLLKKIIPVIEMDFKKLTSSDDQRVSYRAHMIQAVEDTLAPAIALTHTGQEETQELEEQEVDINVGETPQNDPSFIDIRTDKEKSAEEEIEEPDEKDDFGIEGQDQTGRNVAFDTFKKIGTNIVDAYDILSADEDRELFYDYLITNLKLYFDKFENDMGVVQEPTTDEYEAEVGQKAEPEAELSQLPL